ncbi:MAG: 4Fe-4S dicluster domain-containing protein [Chloroflexi bacterium]|nr:4Fe-4S dicluster domain-containing protein [Chloroflexota bacterium]
MQDNVTKINRRAFLKGASAASAVLSGVIANPFTALAAQGVGNRPNGFAMLSDLTKCVGCRRCEAACNRVHNLPAPDLPFEDPSVLGTERRPDDRAYTVVNRYKNLKTGKAVFRKTQCNHCAEPACASACLVGALRKTPEGPVVYDEELCIGCRYCMTACPFYIPAFEYSDATEPAIRKCSMCYHRVANGIVPACAEACAVEAITFGKRAELIKLARDRIRNEPNKYIDHIYGEHEAGGTDWLYVSGVPFEEVKLPTDIGATAFPEFTKEFLSAVPLVLVVWPGLLGGLYAWTRDRERNGDMEANGRQKEDIQQ